MASIYPKLPADREMFHLQMIEGILERLKKDLTNYTTTSKKIRSKSDKYRTAGKLLGSTGTAIGVAGGTLGATGVGIIAGGSLIGLGALLGAGSVISMQLEKRILNKLIKDDKLVTLADSKLRTIEVKISKALDDRKISESEFESIYDEESKYKQQREEILNPVKLVGQSKNSSSTRELADQLSIALKNLKRSSQLMST